MRYGLQRGLAAARIPVLCTTALLLAGGARADATSGAPEAAQNLRERLAAEVDRFADRFDGVVLVARGSDVLVERALGLRDGRTDDPNRPDTLFRIGSLTKQLTAATVLTLVDEGHVALDAPVSRYLPDLPPACLERDGVSVTIEHLLRHQSGLVRAEKLPSFRDRMWSEAVTPAMFLSDLADTGPGFVPGTRYAYSNTGYMLLGEVVRRLTGGTYEAALRARVLDPLGMADTGIVPDAARQARMARGRFPIGPVRLDAAEAFALTTANLSDLRASGSAYSSARDLLRFSRIFLDPGAGPLRPATVAAMTTPGLDDYGFGVVIPEADGPWRQVWHNGALSPLGFSSELVVFPAQGFVVVVLSNEDYALETGKRLRKNLVAILKGEAPAQPLAPPATATLGAAAVGVLTLFQRGAARLAVFPLLLAWWLIAALRTRPRSRLDWIERTLAPLALATMALGLLPPDGAHAMRAISVWGGAALLAGAGFFVGTRERCLASPVLPFLHKPANRHAMTIGLTVACLLWAAAKLDPLGIPRILLAGTGIAAALWVTHSRILPTTQR